MNNKQQNILAAALVLACIVLRITSQNTFIANFTPVLAMGLFAGSIFTNKKIAIALPLITMLIGDLYLQYTYTTHHTQTPGFYGMSQLFNYAAYALVAFIGTRLKNKTAFNVLGYGVIGSLVFFSISNFGVWADTTFNLYPKTMDGLINCFIAAIPFYKNSFVSDLFFSAIFFGGYVVWSANKNPSTVKA